MTQETVNYATYQDAQDAKSRRSVRHRAKQEPRGAIKKPDGTYDIVWTHDDDPEHSTNQIPRPRRPLTERQLLEELKPSDVDII